MMRHKKFFSACLLLMSAVAASWGEETAPKYIFYFIGDGMGHGHVMSAMNYRRMVEPDKSPLVMTTLPVASVSTTYSASSPVTDSAAAGTALASGVKTRNNMLGMDVDSVAVNSIAVDLDSLGYGIGLVTNVCPDDATPAAFYAHVPNRGMVYDIGVQAARSPVKFLAGSYLRGAMRGGRYTGLYERFRENGVDIVRGLDNLTGSEAERVVVLCTDSLSDNGGYAIDNVPTSNPLPDLTDAAISHLRRTSPDRFFLMVEGGNIDWAGHDNDGPTIVKEVLLFDEALARAYDFYLAHPDETLIVVTADHETGGMSVGQESTGYNFYPQYVDVPKISKAGFNAVCDSILHSGEQARWEDMKVLLADKLGFYGAIPVSAAQDSRLQETFGRTFITRNDYYNDALYHRFPEFVEAVYEIINDRAGFGFTTPKHSGNPVPLYAVGVGAEQFTRQMDNTDIPSTIRRIIKQ